MIGTLSKHKAEADGFDDALMLDWRGQVAEGTGANVFFVMDGELHTPTPDCFLNGITRRTVMSIARRHQIKVVERAIQPDEMKTAREVFLAGTAAEVTPVRQIGDLTFTPGRITETLLARLRGPGADGARRGRGAGADLRVSRRASLAAAGRVSGAPPPCGGLVVGLVRRHPGLAAIGEALLLPERRACLEPVDQERGGFQRRLTVGGGGEHQHDGLARLKPADPVHERAAEQAPTAASASAAMPAIARSVMPG